MTTKSHGPRRAMDPFDCAATPTDFNKTRCFRSIYVQWKSPPHIGIRVPFTRHVCAREKKYRFTKNRVLRNWIREFFTPVMITVTCDQSSELRAVLWLIILLFFRTFNTDAFDESLKRGEHSRCACSSHKGRHFQTFLDCVIVNKMPEI